MSRQSAAFNPSANLPTTRSRAVLSISHRITGIVLSVGAIVLVWWLSPPPAAGELCASCQVLGSFFGLLSCSPGLTPGGSTSARHPAPGLGYRLRPGTPQVYLGGWIVVGASVGFTIRTWIVGLIVW